MWCRTDLFNRLLDKYLAFVILTVAPFYLNFIKTDTPFLTKAQTSLRPQIYCLPSLTILDKGGLSFQGFSSDFYCFSCTLFFFNPKFSLARRTSHQNFAAHESKQLSKLPREAFRSALSSQVRRAQRGLHLTSSSNSISLSLVARYLQDDMQAV